MKLIIAAILFIFTALANATITKTSCGISIKDTATTRIYFVNGILNDLEGACGSSDSLMSALNANGVDTSNINVSYFNNPTNGWHGTGDINELYTQAFLSNSARSTTLQNNEPIDKYYVHLGSLYNSFISLSPNDEIAATTKRLYDRVVSLVIDNHESVVLVPHSQGNFYVEAVYSMLKVNLRDDVLRKLRFVGVASVANFPPLNRYVSISQDEAVYLLQPLNAGLQFYTPAFPSGAACISPCSDPAGSSRLALNAYVGPATLLHLFSDVYLNQNLVDATSNVALPKIIADLVKSSLKELASVGVPIVVFDNLGDKQFCMISGVPPTQGIQCNGELIGLLRLARLGGIDVPLNKSALPFDVPAGSSASLASIELPLYLTSGTNQVFINVLPNLNGLPDTSSAPLASKLLTGAMTPVINLFTTSGFPTILVAFDPGAIVLNSSTRYWVEVTAPAADTVATWAGLGLNSGTARSSKGGPYAIAAVAQPAMRVVVTPR